MVFLLYIHKRRQPGVGSPARWTTTWVRIRSVAVRAGHPNFVDPSDSVVRAVSSGGLTAQVWKLQTSPEPALNLVAHSASIGGARTPGFFTSISSDSSDAIYLGLVAPKSSSAPFSFMLSLPTRVPTGRSC